MALCLAPLLAAAADPLAAYLGNTLICLDRGGRDLGHLWLGQGVYVVFGGLASPRQGVFTRTDGGICLQAPPPRPALPPAMRPAPAPPNPFPGLCLRLAPHAPGDRWTDPALPGRRLVLRAGQV